jgi:hypothetical protein
MARDGGAVCREGLCGLSASLIFDRLVVRRGYIRSMLTRASPEKPNARAATGVRSMTRPRVNGPRSVTRHVIDLPPLLTRSIDPNGWRLCAHVIARGLNASPLAVRRPLYEYGYDAAIPASAAIDSAVASNTRTDAATATNGRDTMALSPHAHERSAPQLCPAASSGRERKARMGRTCGSNRCGGNLRSR